MADIKCRPIHKKAKKKFKSFRQMMTRGVFSKIQKYLKNFIFHVTEKPNFKFVVVRMLVKTSNVRRQQHDIKKKKNTQLLTFSIYLRGNGGRAICRRHIYIDLCKNGYRRISSKRDFSWLIWRPVFN